MCYILHITEFYFLTQLSMQEPAQGTAGAWGLPESEEQCGKSLWAEWRGKWGEEKTRGWERLSPSFPQILFFYFNNSFVSYVLTTHMS